MPKVLRIDVQQEPAYAYKPQVAVISKVGETETEDEEDSWMTEIKAYLLHSMLPTDIKRAHKVQLQAKRYAIRNKDLYRKSASGVLQKCLLPRQGREILNRIHQEEEGNHSGARNLALKAMRQGYYWPEMQLDAMRLVQRCDKYSASHTPLSRIMASSYAETE
ncbi:hypothetical protein ACHQM5_019536 [Ranunculus cassubicifolius]